MVEGLCIPTESKRSGEDDNSPIPKIVFKAYNEAIDRIGFICLVSDYFKQVHLKSHNELISLEGFKVNHIEAKIAEWAYRHCFVHLAMDGDTYVGFMVYESEKDVFGYIRAMYFDEHSKHQNLAWGFIKVLVQKGIKKVLALSYEHNVEFKESKRKKLICKKDGLCFWDVDLSYGRK